MKEDKVSPKDAKIISAILRSSKIEQCEPKVIELLLGFAYRYCNDVLGDAKIYSKHCNRETISAQDIKLAIQTKVIQKMHPTPSKKLLQSTADAINKNPLTSVDTENLLRAPNAKSGFYGMEYEYKE